MHIGRAATIGLSALILAAFAVFGGAMAVGWANAQDRAASDPGAVPTSTGEVAAGFTEDGRTYGPLLTSADGNEKVPDLVSVEGDHGKLGYADSPGVLGENEPAPSSPEEALRLQSERAKNPVVIPVFAKDGITKIDTFTIGRGKTRAGGKDE
jgi:hypothetical protein